MSERRKARTREQRQSDFMVEVKEARAEFSETKSTDALRRALEAERKGTLDQFVKEADNKVGRIRDDEMHTREILRKTQRREWRREE